MMQNRDNAMVQAEMQQCIQNCLNCYTACMNAVNGEREGSKHGKSQHTTMMQDCAEMCMTAAHFMEHNSPLFGYVCQTCAQVCNHCAGECERMGDTNCANACRNCAWSCEQMAKLVA